MILARFLSKIFTKEGIVLIDSEGQKYICGEVKNKEKPITLKLLKKNLNWKLLIYPELYLGEEYYKGNIEIEIGTIYEFLNLALKNLGRKQINVYSTFINNLFYAYKFLRSHNFIRASKRNAEMHYNRGEDLYDWMLDKDHRQYSCALFKDAKETLEQAQTNKLSHIVKKLNLKPGQRVLDIGCGWGGLSRYIAKEFGCEVHGISLASNQIEYCKRKARESKLDNLLSYELCDYREVKGSWDRIVNVGFFEHVSPKFYKTFFKKIHNLLKDNGDSLCLTHTIATTNPPGPANPFINKYIFNGGKVPSASQITKSIESSGLVISGWESLIDHYNLTLDHWRERFLKNVGKAKKTYGANFVRLWDFYLSSCSAGFKWSDLLVYQIETVKDFKSVPGRTRDYIYN